jgi:formylglycine-generating enzyme required for sulfatase activity
VLTELGLNRVREGNLGRDLLERVRYRLVDLLAGGHLGPVERATAGRALAKLGDPRPGVELRDDGLPDIVWCEVPAGPFLSGDDKERDESITEPYRIGRYPVTNAQFETFVQAGGYQKEQFWREAIEEDYWSDDAIKAMWDDSPYTAPEDYGEPFNLPNHPVVGVTWYESMAFCRWLTALLREREEIGKNERVGLPSEAQWEKAARGTDGRAYPWGDEPDPGQANYSDTTLGTTSAVGCFPGGRSPYGVEDASGNVWEWIEDDPGVLCGGAFLNPAPFVRCASGYFRPPHHRGEIRGFRVCLVSLED